MYHSDAAVNSLLVFLFMCGVFGVGYYNYLEGLLIFGEFATWSCIPIFFALVAALSIYINCKDYEAL